MTKQKVKKTLKAFAIIFGIVAYHAFLIKALNDQSECCAICDARYCSETRIERVNKRQYPKTRKSPRDDSDLICIDKNRI